MDSETALTLVASLIAALAGLVTAVASIISAVRAGRAEKGVESLRNTLTQQQTQSVQQHQHFYLTPPPEGDRITGAAMDVDVTTRPGGFPQEPR